MTTNRNNYCVILAGGKGRRLWPVSRENYPKQFIDFFGIGRTQLQQTYDRLAKLLPPENIFVNTNQAYANIVRQQLPQLDESRLLAEPIYRNTAPSVAWASFRMAHLNPDARLMVVPSDQMVLNEEAFATNVQQAFAFFNTHKGILTMGVKPTRPEPGYGYIQKGDEVATDIYAVQSFTEKPEREFATLFMQSGEFLWNTGIFVSTTEFLNSCFKDLLPDVLTQVDELHDNYTVENENRFVAEHFSRCPNLSIDYGVFEKTEDIFVMRCDFGWADVGTWHSIYEMKQKSATDNVVVDCEAILDDCRNNIIKLPKERLAVINGLEGFIVAEKDNVLFICKKEDSSALIRKYVNEIKLNKGDKFV